MSGRLTKMIGDLLIDSHRQFGWRAERESLFSPRRIDVLAISKAGLDVIGYEIKTSRQDFLNELRDPDKRTTVLRYCTQFYFVVPSCLVKPDEVPTDCGLIDYDLFTSVLSVVKKAPNKHYNLPFEMLTDDDEDDWTCDLDPEPSWWLPQYRMPLHFQFDVETVAAGMATVAREPFIASDEVPF